MPLIPRLIPNTAVLQRIATLPLTTYQAGETVFAAGTKTGRLLILRKGAVTIEKEGIEIAKVTEPGAVLGELSALLDQSHTADVRTLETSQFRVARAELLEEDPVILLYVSAILAQRLNLASEALIELKSQVQLHHISWQIDWQSSQENGRTAKRYGRRSRLCPGNMKSRQAICEYHALVRDR
jgi:CRP/FNR family cyclic AMP-dependent transcriptional regulator